MQNVKLNIWQRAVLEVLWFGARAFAILPYWFKYYVVQNIIFFLLYYPLRYRMKVVDTNLRNSFPEKSKKERKAIRRGFYKTLSEMFVDTINMAHKSEKKLRRLISIKDIDKFRRDVQGRDWIGVSGHFGCWEYYNYFGLYDPTHMAVAVYHPLHSEVFEELFLRIRKYENSMMVPMREAMLFYLRNREKGIDGKNIAFGLVADQNPPKRPNSHWFHFLNQDTIFFDGGEKLALRCNLPVYFLGMRRMQRGCYEMFWEQIYDGVEEVSEYEITGRYVRRLEAMIRKQPELWMWSHRRWKHRRDS